MALLIAPVTGGGVCIRGGTGLTLRAWAAKWIARAVLFVLTVVMTPPAIAAGGVIGDAITAVLLR